MGLLFRNWLEEGYYEEDEMGNLTKVDDLNQITELRKDGKLYHHDGYSLNKKIYTELKICDDDN